MQSFKSNPHPLHELSHNTPSFYHEAEEVRQLLDSFGCNTRVSGTASGSEWFNSNNLFSSYNPATGYKIADIEQTTPEQAETIIHRSQEAFLTWRDVPAPRRGEMVRLIGDELRRLKKQLGLLVALEMGKSIAEGEGEVQEMIDMADYCAGQSRMLYGLTTHSERASHRLYEQWQPLGIVGIFSAFNFPVAVWAWNAFLAMICGDTIIWKPSPKTPLCAIITHKICVNILAVHGYANVLSLLTSTSVSLAQSLVKDRRLPLISFTGSTAVGREVGIEVAKRFGRSILELSGNNAIILDKSVNLTTALPALVFAAIGTAGQRCTTLRRLIVHESIYNQVLELLKHAYAQLKIGNPTNPTNHMGPLIDQNAVNLFKAAINNVGQYEANIVYGGRVISGNFVEPTIIEAKPEWEIVQQETFAPILYVMPFKTIGEAIAINNAVAHGLSSAIFTENMYHMEHFLSAHGSDCGIANVNIGTSGAEIGGAFGGEKETGGGRESGSDAWKMYMRRQTVTINYGEELTLAQGINFKL
ncbi:MAG: aldehyde dehydrogenase family protein [Burkholderiales bacterium]|nr:aldehyde dehydrogenase family protein [Burkholderiales bacterium]